MRWRRDGHLGRYLKRRVVVLRMWLRMAIEAVVVVVRLSLEVRELRCGSVECPEWAFLGLHQEYRRMSVVVRSLHVEDLRMNLGLRSDLFHSLRQEEVGSSHDARWVLVQLERRDCMP